VSRLAALISCALSLAASGAGAEDLPPLRDPMQPFAAAAIAAEGQAAAPRFRLTAVLIASARQVAILNGKPYQRGELVDGAEIVRIEPDAVHLRQRGEDFVIPLGRLGRSRQPISQGETAQ
jgi:hypothetical protein